MDALLAGIAASELATALRLSRWLYAAVNTSHVLGIALLVGAIVPLDLRLIGLWRGVAHDGLARVLVPVAATGLALAVLTGTLLFAVRATEYAAVPAFQLKLALIGIGAGAALLLHSLHGFRLEGVGSRRLAGAGALSLACWVSALVAGRMIAFTAD